MKNLIKLWIEKRKMKKLFRIDEQLTIYAKKFTDSEDPIKRIDAAIQYVKYADEALKIMGSDAPLDVVKQVIDVKLVLMDLFNSIDSKDKGVE